MVDSCQSSSNSLQLIGVMDRLWFQQIILFPSSELLLVSPPPPTARLASHPHEQQQSTQPQDDQTATTSTSSCLLSSEFTSSSQNSSSSTLSSEDVVGLEEEEEEMFQSSSPNTTLLPPSQLQDDDNNTDEEELMFKSKRPARLALIESRGRSRSSSPSLKKIPLHLRANTGANCAMSPLRKTSSCRSLCEELELEELKGFMDLGFRFEKEKLCPRMMSVIPGLQRYGSNESNGSDEYEEVDDINDDGSTKKMIMRRPYLSEAWLIKSPNSPLLNLRMPPAKNSTVMKKHLKSWARTVASVVQVEY